MVQVPRRERLIAGSLTAGLSLECLRGDTQAKSWHSMREEPRAAKSLFPSDHLTCLRSASVGWRKTRSAPRRMRNPIGGRLSPDIRARRCALAINEYSDDDDQRLTIRASQRQGQRVGTFSFPF